MACAGERSLSPALTLLAFSLVAVFILSPYVPTEAAYYAPTNGNNPYGFGAPAGGHPWPSAPGQMQGFQAPNPTSPTFSQLPGNGAMNVGSPSELGAMGSMGLNSNPQKPPTFPHTAAEPYTQQQSPFTPPYGQLQQQQQQQPQLQQQPYRHPHMQQQQQHPHQQQYPHQQHQHLQQQHYSQHFTQQQPQQQPLPQGPVVLSKVQRGRTGVFSSIFGAPSTNSSAAASLHGQSILRSAQKQPESSLVGSTGEEQGYDFQQGQTQLGGGITLARLSDGTVPSKSPFGAAAAAAGRGGRSASTAKRSKRFSAWRGAQPNEVQLVTVGDSALFQGLCIGEAKMNDPRMPCGVAYPGMAALALQLSMGPPDAEVKSVDAAESVPKRPIVLLSTTARDGVEGTTSFVDGLLERSWIASGNRISSSSHTCDLGDGGPVEWGAGPVGYFTRGTANRETAALTSVLDDLLARSSNLTSGPVGRPSKLIYLGSSRTSEYATIVSILASEPDRLLGAYLTIGAEVNSTSRQNRRISNNHSRDRAREFTFRRDSRSMRGARLDFIVTIAGPRFQDSSASYVPFELKTAVGMEIAKKLRSVVDRYMAEAFDDQSARAEKRLTTELPILFVQIASVRLVRDATASHARLVKVETMSHTGDPMSGLGVPIVLYTTAVGASFPAYILGHLKSSGLTNIIRHTVTDVRSLGPMHQPAIAGHVGALREDVTRFHEWLSRVGPTWPITTSVGSLLDLLLKSHEEAMEKQEKCRAATESLNLPSDDPMLDYADMFCQFYPQTYFAHSAGKEELEAYALRVGLTLRELLGGGEERDEGDEGAAHSLAAFDETLGLRRRRLSSNVDESGEEEYHLFGDGWSLTSPLDDVITSHSGGETDLDEEREPRDGFSASVMTDEGFSRADGSPSPSASRTVDPVDAYGGLPEVPIQVQMPPPLHEKAQQQQHEMAAEVDAIAAASAHQFSSPPLASLGPDAAIGMSVDPFAFSRAQDSDALPDRQQLQSNGNSTATPDAVVEPLLERLRREFEVQAAQQRHLLRRIAIQQERQSRMQEQQAKLLLQRQQQQHQEELMVPPTQHEEGPRSTVASNTKTASPPSEPAVQVEERQTPMAKTSAVLFPGINMPHEGDAATRQKLLLQDRRGYGDGYYHKIIDEAEQTKLRDRLEERYGTLFLNAVGFLLSDTTLQDLIEVAQWHTNPHAHMDLCNDRRFSLFVLPADSGRFRLVSSPVESAHRHYVNQIQLYDTDAGTGTWRRALEGLKQFQRLFASRV